MTSGITDRLPGQAQVFTPSLDCVRKVTLGVSTSSARVSIIDAAAPTVGAIPGLVLLYCDVACFIRFTTSSGTAVVTDIPLPAATPTPFGVPAGADNIAAITAVGTGTLVIHGVSN
jgi:hypothetical protein